MTFQLTGVSIRQVLICRQVPVKPVELLREIPRRLLNGRGPRIEIHKDQRSRLLDAVGSEARSPPLKPLNDRPSVILARLPDSSYSQP